MTFASDLSKFILKAGNRVDTVTRKIVIDLGTAIVLRTPVGNPSQWQSPAPPGYVGGRARANWQYGNGDIPEGVLDTVDLGGNTTVNRIIGNVKASPAASVHWIANNLPYIKPLEEGWSNQAPQGMVRLSVLEFEQVVRNAVKSVN